MEGNSVGIDSATQTSDFDDSDEELPNASPRVVIDTSAPFGSVEEAVIRFGGRGFWIPGSILSVDAATATDQLEPEVSNINKLEERAAAMLKDLQLKEKETHDILNELDLTKRLVEELKLKLKLPEESHECRSVPCFGFDKERVEKDSVDYINSQTSQTYKPEEHSNMCASSAAGLIMMELKQAKLNLYQNTNELAAIRASVESLSKKLEKEESSAGKGGNAQNANALQEAGNSAGTVSRPVNPLVISRELKELNYEADQFMKTAEAAKSEVLRAMSDIEQTKTGLKVIEMRWSTAKKLEEAARAAESLALAEIRALSSSDSIALEDYHQQKLRRISLTLEEYSALTDKARKAENLFKRRDFEAFRKFEEATDERFSKMALEDVFGRVDAMNRRKLPAEEAVRRFSSDPAHRKPPESTQSHFRNPDPSQPRRDSRLLDTNDFEFLRNEPKTTTRATTSIGDILSRKLVMRDDLEIGRLQEEGGAGRQRVSLNQMLRRHRGETETSPTRRREKNGDDHKPFFSKRKGLGLVHISFPLSKNGKNKIQALNLW